MLVVPDELAPSADVTVPGRLRLRRATPHDLEVVYAIHSDPRTNIHNPAGPDRDRRASQARLTEWLEHWEEHGFGYQVVELTDLPMSVIGFTGVRRSTWSDVPVLNLYYRYAADHHGHGYATEGARHVVAWAAARYPATPVVAITTLDNTGSQRTDRGSRTCTTATAGAPVAWAVGGRPLLELAARHAVAGSPTGGRSRFVGTGLPATTHSTGVQGRASAGGSLAESEDEADD